MKTFITENFLLHTNTAQELYFNYAVKMPIIDYHNHLSPADIANDRIFANISEAWLDGDHYKWRAMRANGIKEQFITGDADAKTKFLHWAATVPQTVRNPLYHWTHLELQRYLGIEELLNENSAEKIFQTASEKINTKENSVKNLLRKLNVQVLCTTDDPCDDLQHHQSLKDNFEIKVLPAFRPDKGLDVQNVDKLNEYIEKLSAICNMEIDSFDAYLLAFKQRHDFFAKMGCTISDHGLEAMYAVDYTMYEVRKIFLKARRKEVINNEEADKFKSAMMYHFAIMNAEKAWVQQFHLGPLRNNNTRLMNTIGADSGADSIGDKEQAQPLSRFLDALDKDNKLSKTILYNLNPKDSEVFAAMAGNFQDGNIPGKMQYGAAWWFLDQKDGIEKQLNVLSNFGLMSRFVGMVTDSRSFLSFPRHEYFRRILCNIIGNEVQKGELPNDVPFLGKIVEDISFNNAKEYFGFK